MHIGRSKSVGVVLMLAFLLPARGAETEDPLRIFNLGEDRFATGTTVTVSQPTGGDLIAAGRNVEVNAPVTGDLVSAGRYVRVLDRVAQDAYVAGQEVTIAGAIERNARVAGSMVTLERSARVEGGISAAGREIRIDGAVGSYLQAAGQQIVLNGPIAGDVHLAGERIELGPQARIDGRLRYRSDQTIRQDPGAEVTGGIERTGSFEPDADGGGWFRWVWLIGLMILAAVLVAALPAFTRRTAETVTSRFGMTLLVGVAALLVIPALLVFAAITVVGIPLALVMLLSYLMLLLVGFVFAGIAAGDMGLRRVQPAKHDSLGWRSLAAAVAVAVLALLTFIPVLGGFIALLALLVGMGAIVAQWRTRDRTAPA